MTNEQATAFAREWIEAWNSHDLDRILAHYSDGFEMSSPLIVRLMDEPSGRLTGKERVRSYWQLALARSPDLWFELVGVYCGADSIVIHYRNQADRIGAEAFFFDEEGLVFNAAAHYMNL